MPYFTMQLMLTGLLKDHYSMHVLCENSLTFEFDIGVIIIIVVINLLLNLEIYSDDIKWLLSSCMESRCANVCTTATVLG